MFQGNLLFSSVSQMKFLKTSRRDDFISLFYMIVYLLNDHKTVTEHDKEAFESNKLKPINEQFKKMKSYKKKYSLV